MLVGRYGQFAPSVWVYAANAILAALVMLRLIRLAGAPAGEGDNWQVGLIALIVVALISVGISLIRPTGSDVGLSAARHRSGVAKTSVAQAS
jgi:hypothetical protein